MEGNDTLMDSQPDDSGKNAKLPLAENTEATSELSRITNQTAAAQLKANLIGANSKFAANRLKNVSRTQHSKSFLSPINEDDDLYDRDII